MADRTVKVTLSAQVAGYVAGMQEAAKATRDAGSETEKLGQQKQAFEQMGRTAMVAGGAMAAGLALSTKAAIDWDSAWAGVTKTVDGTPEQMAELEGQLRSLTGVLPASHAEIAAVAEAAGQLGIQRGNVAAFTKTMIDLGETTNLSAETAATSLARFMNIMGTAKGDVEGLGSALVALGNNYATTEAEIMEMGMRLAGAGKQIGMSEGQVLGLSTALSSVGVEAEAGGSAMSKVMIDIASSVEKGGDRVQKFAEISGMSADAFSAQWRNDPGEALASFVTGLSNVESQGKSAFGVLEELGITEVRMRDALLRSSAAAGQFSSAMADGNKAMAENSALTDEAEKRYETSAAKLSIMGNKVVDAAISLGEHFLPALEAGADAVGSFADMLSGLDGPMGAVVAWGGLIASGILLTGGIALASVPKIAAYKIALETLNISTAGLGGKLRGLGSFLMGPWGIALMAAALSARAFTQTLDASAVSAEEMTNALKQGESAFETMTDKATANEHGIAKVFADVNSQLEDLPALADKAATAGRGFWSSMSFNENTALDSIKALGDSLATLSATDLPTAQQAFKAFVKDSGLSDAQALTFMNEEMTGFKSSLLDAAKAADVATDDTSLLKLAMGEIGPAAREGAEGADDQAKSLEDLQGVASATSDSVSELADQIRGFGSAQIDAESASIAFHEELAELQALVDSGASGLDKNTEAGRANSQALIDMASKTNAAAGAAYAANGSTEQLNGTLARGRDALVQAGIAFGMTKADAKKYADQLIATPQTVKTNIELTGVDAATEKLTVMERIMNSIAQGRTADVFLKTTYQTSGTPPSQLGPVAPESASGNLFEFANGGGLDTGIYSGGTPITRFAEPETVWEAFISGKPDQRDRNRQIWQETGNRLGMNSGGQATVYVPSHVTVVDAGNQLITTMQVVANQEIDGYAEAQQAEGRRF